MSVEGAKGMAERETGRVAGRGRVDDDKGRRLWPWWQVRRDFLSVLQAVARGKPALWRLSSVGAAVELRRPKELTRS